MFRRSLIALGMAAMLPTLAFMAVGAFLLLRAESARVEADSLARSRVVMTLIDASLQGDAAALGVLASSIYFDNREWKEFYPRLARAAGANPHWATLVLYDAQRAEEILDLRRPLTAPRPGPLVAGGDLSVLRHSTKMVVGEVQREPEPLVFVFMPVMRDQQLAYVLAAGIRPQVYQDILLAQAPPGATSAVVDTHGRFIARTLDFQNRVGQPATRFVRDAIRTSTSGLYRGTTYEGIQNYTAFFSSPWSGWSAHIAIASSLIDTPTSWSFIVAAAAAIGSAVLGATLVVLVLRDMAERRRNEDVLRQSQKMEAVGQLTGGIAHDFNNLLTAIVGNLDMIRTRAVGQERIQRMATNALEAARRGAKLTSQLLAFSRTQRMQLQPVDLQQLLTGMNSLLAQSVGPTIEVRIALAADARTVLTDPNQLELAILNLAVNARDAMPDGGSLTFASTIAVGPTMSSLANKPCVKLSITDTGAGMSEEVRTRATEPFFTTKPVGQGTGLGLSQVYGIVRESGGALDIVSSVNAGTTVHLYLAPVMNAATTLQPLPQNETAIHGRAPSEAAILVCDDDRQVRSFLVYSLQQAGYRVTETATGEAALNALRAASFDLLVLDFAMPHMNGAEVARCVHAVRPATRILMVSGYSDSAAIDAVMKNVQLLRKPFDVTELLAAVRHCLAD
jgi:signal transduction histidine kinase/CheY-like chemotaxis protein